MFLHRSMLSFPRHCDLCTDFGKVALNVLLGQEKKFLLCVHAEKQRRFTYHVNYNIQMSNSSTCGPDRKIPVSLVMDETCASFFLQHTVL